MAKVSLFKTCFATTPIKDIDIYDFYAVVLANKYFSEIHEIRQYPEQAQALKKELPCLTLSGTFNTRNLKGLKEYSQRICLDIDGKENPHIFDWSTLRDSIGTWKEVEFVALSASGQGLFLTIPVLTPENHKEHFQSLKRVFHKLGITIDNSCQDITRLRFMTADPYAILNESAVPYCMTDQSQIKNHRTSIRPCSSTSVEEAIQEALRKGIDITKRYANWYQIGCALVNEYGETGRSLFHQLSGLHPKYNFSECDLQYDKCLKNPKSYSAGTIYYYLKLCSC